MTSPHSIPTFRPLTRLGALLLVVCAAALAGPLMSSASASTTHCYQSIGGSSCIISEPDVQHQLTNYPQISLFAGQHVTLSGGGCYQTGGHGKTWKRFVDPISNYGEYQAQFAIPGTIPTTAALQDYENVTVTVQKNTTLELGVYDMSLGDNGYWGRSGDDGTYGQCGNLGNAWFRVVIS